MTLTRALVVLLCAATGACSTDHAVVAVLDSNGTAGSRDPNEPRNTAGSGGNAGSASGGCGGQEACGGEGGGGSSFGGGSGAPPSGGRSGMDGASNTGGAAGVANLGGAAGADEPTGYGGAIFTLGGIGSRGGGVSIETGGFTGSREREVYCACSTSEQVHVCDANGEMPEGFCIGNCLIACFRQCPCEVPQADPNREAMWFKAECLETMQCPGGSVCFDQAPGAEPPMPLLTCSP